MGSAYLENATLLVDLLDDRFKIFGFKFGIDPLLGLVPGWGDFVSFLISLYLVWVALKLKLPGRKILRMLFNLSLDFIPRERKPRPRGRG